MDRDREREEETEDHWGVGEYSQIKTETISQTDRHLLWDNDGKLQSAANLHGRVDAERLRLMYTDVFISDIVLHRVCGILLTIYCHVNLHSMYNILKHVSRQSIREDE